MQDGQTSAGKSAAQLHEQLSGLLQFVDQLNSVDGFDYWVIQVPVGILEEVWRTEIQLPLAIQQENIAKLAFLCRNALELHIWALYVSSSRQAAKRFHQDAYVDATEALRLMDKAFKHTPSEFHPAMKSLIDPLAPEFQRVLVRDKVGLSVAQLRAMKHLQIASVAEDVGYGPVYEVWNPLLSKLVHATAYNVLIAGKDMEGIGNHLVEQSAVELRSTVVGIDKYLLEQRLPRFQ